MSLKDFSDIAILYESEHTLLKTGMQNGDKYILKQYKGSSSRVNRDEKIKKENEIHNRLDPDSSKIILDLGTNVQVRRFNDGVPLSKYLQIWEFDLTQLLNIAIDLTEELRLIHQAKILHLDLNPSNVIYDTISKKSKIIDFGSASYVSSKGIYVENAELAECDLNYISPEQTGRINRIVDLRSDLYSLGVLLYEMCTNQKLYDTQIPLELVHCHIAKEPSPPSSVNHNISVMIDKIILKLLSKNSEDRYHSDYGLEYDLKRCLEDLTKNGEISVFELGTKDVSDQFRVSQKTYGRDKEIAMISKTFKRCCMVIEK